LLDAQQKDGMDLGATDELERNLVKQKKSEDGRIQYGT
jgi:hypothetical protein